MPRAHHSAGYPEAEEYAMVSMEAAATTIESVTAVLDAEGYCIVERLLSPDAAQEAKASLVEVLAATPRGRNSFEGFRTQRVYALFAKTRAFDAPAVHPLVLGVLDHVLGHYQLSAPVGI